MLLKKNMKRVPGYITGDIYLPIILVKKILTKKILIRKILMKKILMKKIKYKTLQKQRTVEYIKFLFQAIHRILI